MTQDIIQKRIRYGQCVNLVHAKWTHNAKNITPQNEKMFLDEVSQLFDIITLGAMNKVEKEQPVPQQPDPKPQPQQDQEQDGLTDVEEIVI